MRNESPTSSAERIVNVFQRRRTPLGSTLPNKSYWDRSNSCGAASGELLLAICAAGNLTVKCVICPTSACRAGRSNGRPETPSWSPRRFADHGDQDRPRDDGAAGALGCVKFDTRTIIYIALVVVGLAAAVVIAVV
jgi:hypothetical protein